MTAVASGPDWASATTAIGTVLVAIMAVGVAIYTEWRANKRLKAKHKRSRLLADERERSDEALRKERQLAQDREQLAEAYSVQVVLMRFVMQMGEDPASKLEVNVVNHGRARQAGQSEDRKGHRPSRRDATAGTGYPARRRPRDVEGSRRRLARALRDRRCRVHSSRCEVPQHDLRLTGVWPAVVTTARTSLTCGDAGKGNTRGTGARASSGPQPGYAGGGLR